MAANGVVDANIINSNNDNMLSDDDDVQSVSFSDLKKNNKLLIENNAAFISENSLLRAHVASLTDHITKLQVELKSLRDIVANSSNSVTPRKIPRTLHTDNSSAPNNNNNNNNNIDNLHFTSASAANQQGVKPISSIKKKKKIIQCININANKLNEKLKSKKIVNYTIKQNNNKAPVKININDINEVNEIKKILTNENVSFHEYKWDDEKQKAYIIKGLVSAKADDLPFIRDLLIDTGLPEQIKVSLFTTGYMRSNPNANHNSLIQVITPPNTDPKQILNIKYIDHISVKIEPQINNKVIQCKNCQRFGHSAGGCQHAHRCVKCSGNHLKDSCPRSFNKTTVPLLCCNCNGNHTANNLRECPVAQHYLLSFSSGFNNNESNDNINNNNSKLVRNNNKNSNSSGFPVLSSLHPARKNSSNNNNNPINNRVNTSSKNNNYNVRSNNVSYAQVLSGGSLSDISKKLDFLINSVLKHEQILNNLALNE